MRRFSYWPYLFLFIFYFCIFTLPQGLTQNFRSMAVASFSPLWKGLSTLKQKISLFTPKDKESCVLQKKLEDAEQQNILLQSQLEQIKQWLISDHRLHEEYERLKVLNAFSSEFFKGRTQEQIARLELSSQALNACVIFREPALWSSALWVDVGEKQNKQLGRKVIGKNSPVLVGSSIIGVVEYVGKSRSQIRLITDARLTPSVRAVRGREQDRYLFEQIEALLFSINRREGFFSSEEEKEAVLSVLLHLASKLQIQQEDLYLAKGELFGSSAPLWRARSALLKGIGFNYDFADEEGPARNLRTAEPYETQEGKKLAPLLRPGDMLITTGLDGVFPAGFRVGIVSKVNMLTEGASSYEIEALPTAGNLDEISHVVILPPCESEV